MQSYLNNNYYGNRSYGVAAAAQGYWRKDLKDLTLAQYALLAGIPKSPTRLRPRPERGRGERTRPTARTRDRASSSRPDATVVVAAQPDPRAHEDALADAHGRPVHRGRLRGRQERAGRPRLAGRRRVARAALRVEGARRAGRAPVRRAAVREDRHRRLPGDHHARLPDAADRREVGLRRGDHPQRQEPGRGPQGARHPAQRVGVDQGPPRATTSTTRRRGVMDYRTGEVLAYIGSASLHGARATRSSSPSSTSWATAGASPGRRSSRSCT